MKKNITFTTVGIVFLLASFFAFNNSTSAVSKNEWQAGNIISDTHFTDTNAMSTNDIQAFLDREIGSCDIWGTGRAVEYGSSLSRKEYAASRGWSAPPYTCLNKYYEVPKTTATGGLPANNYSDPSSIPSGAQSAAWIIKDAANRYGINPKVLLVKIATESLGPLTSDNWPLFSQYRYAMGSHCPDSGPGGSANCDPAYSGFSIQIYSAAELMRSYLDGMTQSWWPYKKPYQNNTILWNVVERGCGGGNVYLQNKATAALYTYTPYQPNQAALDNMYGTGNNCSAYGNRNFWRVYWDWFGSSRGQPYEAAYISQSSYPAISSGQSATIQITLRNSGSITWYDDTVASQYGAKPVRLGTFEPQNRSSLFGSTWGGDKNRASKVFAKVYKADGTEYSTNPHKASPGESVRFEVTLSAPHGQAAGSYREYFKPLVEGEGYMAGSTMFIDISIKEEPSVVFKAQSGYPSVKPGDSTEAWIEFTNTGNVTLYDQRLINAGNAPRDAKPFRLSTASPDNRSSSFGQGNWGRDGNRPATTFSMVYKKDGSKYQANPLKVAPGESARFSFKITAPENNPQGSYIENFQPIIEGGDPWYLGASAWLRVNVLQAATAKQTSQDVSLTLNPLSEKTIVYSFKNTGNTTWKKESTTLSMVSGASGDIKTDNWVNDTTPARLTEATVAPGSTGNFTVNYRTPANENKTSITLAPTIDQKYISPDTPAKTQLNTNKAVYSASFAGQSKYPTVGQNSEAPSYFRFKNTGNIDWYTQSIPKGAYKINLATQHSINRASSFGSAWGKDKNRAATITQVLNEDGSKSPDQSVVRIGQIAQFDFSFVPDQLLKAGTYREWFSPIAEGSPEWYMGTNAFLDVTVKDSSFSATYSSQSPYPTIPAGQSREVFFRFKNTGSATWFDRISAPVGVKPVVLASTAPINRSSIFFQGNRPATVFSAVYELDGLTPSSDQHLAKPGQIVEFRLTLTAPNSNLPSVNREWFQPILEGGTPWDLGIKAYLDIKVE